MSMEIEEGHHRAASAMAKLELIKEIRSKTDQMYKLKEKLLEEIQNSRKEDQFLVDYRCELEALISEKLSHVEQLRKIHSDIDSMESVIKQAEASKTRSIENAKRLHTEFLPVKSEVDRLRQSCLGLERLPELHEEEPSILSFDLFEPQLDRSSGTGPPQQTGPLSSGQGQGPNWPPSNQQTSNNGHNLQQQQQQQQRDNSQAAMLLNYQKHQQQNSVTQAAVAAFMLSQHHQNGPNMNMNSLLSRSPPTSNKDRQNSLPQSHPNPGPPFRTPQLAPMKKCQSCGHEIHRNAPICPVCKAKSRSRNPKKTKKKN